MTPIDADRLRAVPELAAIELLDGNGTVIEVCQFRAPSVLDDAAQYVPFVAASETLRRVRSMRAVSRDGTVLAPSVLDAALAVACTPAAGPLQ